jgi:hypothetical protein
MRIYAVALLAAGLALGAAGCSQDRPQEYGRARTDVDALNEEDRGLQSKDVTSASDQMARDLLADPVVRASPTQLTIVRDTFEDRTINRDWQTNYDIFLNRLSGNLGRDGKGRVTLILNRSTLANLRSQERDEAPGTMSRIQPDYLLRGVVMDMPNRRTNYYLLEFQLVDLRSGVIAWTNRYEVKVER